MKHDFIMLDYPALMAVAEVIRSGSFERAAETLGVSPSAVSQRVRGLEERLGAILVVRGQPCTATELGRTLGAHLDRVRMLESDLAPVLAAGTGPLTLRVAVNSDSLATWFPAAAAAFAGSSGMLLDLTLDDEGHTAGRLRSGEVVAAVTADPAPVQGCRTHALGGLVYAACACPDFVARWFPAGVDAAALARAPVLRFDRRDRLQARWAAAAHGTALDAPAHWAPSTQGFLDLTLAGMAWAMHPVTLAAPHLAAGRLVELAPGRRVEVRLYWTAARLHAGALRALTDAVRKAARQVLVI